MMETVKVNYKKAHELENLYGDSVNSAIDYAREFKAQYPKRLPKPYLQVKHTSDEASEYSKLLKKYELEEEQFKIQTKACQKHNNELENEIEKYFKEISGFNRIIPENKKDKVWSKAWSDGYSDGLYSVYQHLVGLVDLFND